MALPPRYFQVPSSPASGRPSNAASLNKIFDSFRGTPTVPPPATHPLTPPIADDPTQPDKIGAEGTMRYLQSLAVALDEPVLLAVLAQVSAPALSEMSRDAFVTGWEQRGADTSTKQRAEVARFRSQLRTDPTLFRTVYRHAFVLGKGGEGVGARAVPLDTAVEFWRLLFDPTKGWHWKSADGTEWLEPWLAFLTEKWKKSVGRDLWDQTLAFARKTVEDGSLGWWSEEAAWPSVVDEFVEHVKAERKAGRLPGTADPNSMEVE